MSLQMRIFLRDLAWIVVGIFVVLALVIGSALISAKLMIFTIICFPIGIMVWVFWCMAGIEAGNRH